MSDFISELRREVLDGHERHRQRGRLHRRVRPLHPRAWRPVAIVAAVAIAAGVLIVATTARYLSHPTPGRPHVVDTVAIGGTPTDIAFGGHSLWIGDFGGTVVRVDPRNRRVLARIRVHGQPESIVAGAGSVWVRSPDATGPSGGPLATHVTRIEPRTNTAAPSVHVGAGTALALGPDALWTARRFTTPEAIDRLDPSSGARTARIPLANVDALETTARTLWAVQQGGTVVQIDANSDAIVHTWPQLAPSAAIVADTDGVWLLSTDKAELLRIAAGRIVQRIPISPAARPLLALTADGLWITTSDTLLSHNRLLRIDPETGKTNGALELGARRPVALAAAGATLWVITADGQLMLVH